MKLKKGIKIVLLILSFLIVSFVCLATYMILVIENAKFEYEMLFLVGIILGGALSIVYQIKTLRFYSLKTNTLELTGKLFWIGNLFFSVILFCFSLYFLYFIYINFENFKSDVPVNVIIALVAVVVILVVAVFLAIEISVLYKRILNQEAQNYIDSIDDIKGNNDITD